jgi:hypothetical protein
VPGIWHLGSGWYLHVCLRRRPGAGAVGADDILLDNWEGEAPLVPLIQNILAQEADRIGDQRERTLGYLGYEYLVDEEKDS